MRRGTRNALAVMAAIFGSCCSTDIDDMKVPANVDFARVLDLAEVSSNAYKSLDEIRSIYGNRLVDAGEAPHDIRFFIVKDEEAKTATLAVRGTADLKNVLTDAKYVFTKSKRLGIYLHRGFHQAAEELFSRIGDKLKALSGQGLKLRITGHSLGGAIAVVVMMILEHEGVKVDTVLTYGQPKVTNRAGVRRFRDSPLLRIVDDRDLVPLVPPVTLLTELHGPYRHFGREVILLRDEYFVFLPERVAEDRRVSSFWDNLGNEKLSDHYIKNYIRRATPKRESAKRVPYKDRKKYE